MEACFFLPLRFPDVFLPPDFAAACFFADAESAARFAAHRFFRASMIRCLLPDSSAAWQAQAALRMPRLALPGL